MSKTGITFRVIGVILLILVIAFGLEFLGLHWFKFFHPRWEGAKHTAFKATRAYNEGKLQELSRYRLQYLRSKDPVERSAIASTVRHTFAEYDDSRLPPELAAFCRDCKYGISGLDPSSEAESMGRQLSEEDLNPYSTNSTQSSNPTQQGT